MTKYKRIGRIELGNKAIITDSCYNKLSEYNFIANVRAGEYDCFAVIKKAENFEKLGKRVFEIACIKKGLNETPDEIEWWCESSNIAVDSGSCGIFDLEFFNDNDDEELDNIESGEISDEESEKFYDRMCGLIHNGKHCGTYKHGFNSSSGLGDGCYNFFALKDNEGFIVAMKVVFLKRECDDE